MRETNFSYPQQNKACVLVTPRLYDRRGLDSTSYLPLITSLAHLSHLTASSPRIREIATQDGAIERLVHILSAYCADPPRATSPLLFYGLSQPSESTKGKERVLEEDAKYDRLASGVFSLAFQAVVNIGVRGSELIRTRVVQAGTLEVVGALLETWLISKGHSPRPDQRSRRSQAESRTEEQSSSIAEPAGSASIQTRDRAATIVPGNTYRPVPIPDIISPPPPPLPATSRENGTHSGNTSESDTDVNADRMDVDQPTLPVDTRPIGIVDQDEPQLDISEIEMEMAVVMNPALDEALGGPPAQTNATPRVPIMDIVPPQNPPAIQSSPAINRSPLSASTEQSNQEKGPFYHGDVLRCLQLLAYLTKYPRVREEFFRRRTGPWGCRPDSKKEMTDSDVAEVSTLFSLVERFTYRTNESVPNGPQPLPLAIGTWAAVIMRNACRKDEARGGIRQCANMLCGKWESYAREFAKCRRCRKAKYCGKECQSKAWAMGHRFWCSAREGEGEGEAAEGEGETEMEPDFPSGRRTGEHLQARHSLNQTTPRRNTPERPAPPRQRLTDVHAILQERERERREISDIHAAMPGPSRSANSRPRNAPNTNGTPSNITRPIVIPPLVNNGAPSNPVYITPVPIPQENRPPRVEASPDPNGRRLTLTGRMPVFHNLLAVRRPTTNVEQPAGNRTWSPWAAASTTRGEPSRTNPRPEPLPPQPFVEGQFHLVPPPTQTQTRSPENPRAVSTLDLPGLVRAGLNLRGGDSGRSGLANGRDDVDMG